MDDLSEFVLVEFILWEVAYFGDTAVDMQTANNAGFLAVGVSWGFRPEELQESGAKIIIDKPADILKLIDFAWKISTSKNFFLWYNFLY